jgi:hypothetical protein
MKFLNDEPPEGVFNFEALKSCAECALAKTSLLRMTQKEEQGKCVDAFMVLAKRGSGEFERAGMLMFTDHTGAERKRWFDEVWEVNALPEAVITII